MSLLSLGGPLRSMPSTNFFPGPCPMTRATLTLVSFSFAVGCRLGPIQSAAASPHFYCCFDFDRATYELTPDPNWVNSTGYLRAMMQGFIERLYPYTGDPHTLEFLQNFVDYELENGTTPENYVWAQVPYPSANPGSRRYTGWSNHGEDFVEPHVVGEDGYAYLRLYEMTGTKILASGDSAAAAALVKNFKPGDEKNSPWPFRCLARNGALSPGKGMSPYSANVVEPIMLLTSLIRIGLGDVPSYKLVRDGRASGSRNIR